MTNSKLEISLLNANVKAFLEMIRHSEGTAVPEGYRMMFGGKLFSVPDNNNWPDHPHIFFSYKNKAGQVIKTSAAGAYQITWTTWIALKVKLGLKDFSPRSQDLAACDLLTEAGAMSLIICGNFVQAIDKVRKTWASLPGSGCHQPEHKLAEVEKWYEDAGGNMLAAA